MEARRPRRYGVHQGSDLMISHCSIPRTRHCAERLSRELESGLSCEGIGGRTIALERKQTAYHLQLKDQYRGKEIGVDYCI
jgi:hypothetical protein